jgi:hypothetical protein
MEGAGCEVSLFTNPPRVSKVTLKEGDHHLAVWGLQMFLNGYDWCNIQADGSFGPATDKMVKEYQRKTSATQDGIVGPQTNQRIVRSCIVAAPKGASLPKGLAEGQIDGESGRIIGAVNASVPGGLDLGLTQRRCYGPPYNEQDVMAAINPRVAVVATVSDIITRYKTFASSVGYKRYGIEYAWRLAMLAHNWPFGAQELAAGRGLSTTKIATWVPSSVRFADGTPVRTWAEWAAFYAMGSHAHRHRGLVTGLAFGVPSW